MVNCDECQYSVAADYGYSNYTIEGCDIYCIFNLNLALPVDRFYGEEPGLEIECNLYDDINDHTFVDCEREDTVFDDSGDGAHDNNSYLPKWAINLPYIKSMILKKLSEV